jgi:hypothetical protein
MHQAVPNFFKELNFTKNSGCHGNRKICFQKIFKNLFVKELKGKSLDICHETSSVQGVIDFPKRQIVKTLKRILRQSKKGRAQIFGMKHLLIEVYQFWFK